MMNYNSIPIEVFISTAFNVFPSIDKVISNPPATIIKWSDDTKTVVKCQGGDTYDIEKGIALCYMKKILGNKGNYNTVLNKAINETKKGKKNI